MRPHRNTNFFNSNLFDCCCGSKSLSNTPPNRYAASPYPRPNCAPIITRRLIAPNPVELDAAVQNYSSSALRVTWNVPERYENLKEIACGAFGVVSSAHDKKLNMEVAIKKLLKPFLSSGYAERTYRELRLLMHMDHENIVCLTDVFSPQTSSNDMTELYLVTPLMHADLQQMSSQSQLEAQHIQFIMYQTFRALKYLHSVDVIHRDLKPCNIAVNPDGELRLLDFGMARQQDEDMSLYVTTRWYRAPEIILQFSDYDSKVDIWSAACIMAELILGKPLFAGECEMEQLLLTFQFLGTPDESFLQRFPALKNHKQLMNLKGFNLRQFFHGFTTREGIDLLEKMLVVDPKRRLTAVEALAHPYFINYHEEHLEPNSEPFEDPHDNETKVSVETFKEYIWECMEQFTPKLGSLNIMVP